MIRFWEILRDAFYGESNVNGHYASQLTWANSFWSYYNVLSMVDIEMVKIFSQITKTQLIWRMMMIDKELDR